MLTHNRIQKKTVSLYKAIKKVWMMSFLFKQWVHAFDVKIDSQNRKIMLFVDSCPAYPAFKLTDTELVFLRPNAINMFELLDQVVFQLMKHYICSLLVNYLLKTLETGNWRGCNEMECA
jgi:hypothetical protein